MKLGSFSKKLTINLIEEGLKRKDMPQYEGSYDDLKSFLDERGVLYTKEKVSCRELSPVQNEYSQNKIESLKSKISGGNISPLIVSKSYDILDGHHRWKAGENLNNTPKLPVFRIHMPTHKAFVLLDESIKYMENNQTEEKVVAVYPGRFQPFHRGHENTFNLLQERFGRNHTYLATSDKTEPEKSPFDFSEKKRVITSLYEIPNRFVVKVESPYNPKEITKKYDPDKDKLVVAVGAKDGEKIKRLTGSYYEIYDSEKNLESFKDAGYIFPIKKEEEIQLSGSPISGTQVRALFRSPMPEEKRKKLFEYVFGKFDEEIYELINKKLSNPSVSENNIFSQEELELLSENINVNGLLQEAARTKAAIPADDGPASWYADPEDYDRTEQNLARKMGFEVMDYTFGPEHFEGDPDDFKQDALKFVSFFPSGVFDEHVDDPLRTYRNFSEAVAETAGYEIMKHIGIDEPEGKESVTDEGGSDEETQKTKDTGGISSLDESVDRKIEQIQSNISTSHLRHPFEDFSLTFRDLKDLLDKILRGKLENVREKTDGQNLKVTWKDEKLRAARNKGHLKNNGRHSLTKEELAEKFDGRGDIKDAFVSAFEDLRQCFEVLPDEVLTKVFQGGGRFLSLEVIYEPTQNVIPYGKNLLVLQEVNTYSSDGDLINRSSEFSELIIETINELATNDFDTFTIKKQPSVSMNDLQDKKKDLHRKLLEVISDQKEKYGLSESDTILENQMEKWKRFIDVKARQFHYTIPNKVKEGLIYRWCLGEKSGETGYSLRDVKSDIKNNNFLSFVVDFDKNKVRDKRKEMRKPFEFIFLRLGSEVLANLNFPLIKDHDKAVTTIQKSIINVIEEVKSINNVEAEKKMKDELQRIKRHGGVDKIAPGEGVVFNYNGELYKLTGLFAPINQLLGIIKYNRY